MLQRGIIIGGEIMEINETMTAEMLMKGYTAKDDEYICLYCGKHFRKDQIFEIGKEFFNSRYAVAEHIDRQHGGPLKALLALPSETTGISETQKRLLQLMRLDLTDQEIAEQLEISPSTIRNHRFKLKEKKRQALHFIAMMNLLEEVNEKLAVNEVSIQNYDERFQIEEKERQKVLKTFVGEDGRAEKIPRKEKSKIILLQELAKEFSDQRVYAETDVNQIIMGVFDDYVSIRRYMIQYGFLARTNDGKKYWKI